MSEFYYRHVGDIPDRFCDAGFAVLAYDHRSFGSSDGTPRHDIDLDQQSDDIADAVTWICTQTPAVDPNRIALLGAGHGGGLSKLTNPPIDELIYSYIPVMPMGATDPRIKALLSWIPFISGGLDSQAWPKGHADRMWMERINRALGKTSADKPEYVPIFPEDLETAEQNPYSTMIGLPQAVGFHAGTKALSDAAGITWENKITLQSLFHQQRWEPTVHLPQMKIPMVSWTA